MRSAKHIEGEKLMYGRGADISFCPMCILGGSSVIKHVLSVWVKDKV